nr:unnamed protein product [Digitaria exilis]
MALLAEYSSQELLEAQVQLWNQSLGLFKSVALAIAIDLHIPDTVHRLGGAATLRQILAEAGGSPCRLRDLRRVMRVLTVAGIFTVQRQPSSSEDVVYKLTAASHLLVRDNSSAMSLLPHVQLMLGLCRECPLSRGMHAWFHQQHDEQEEKTSPFAMAYSGNTVWERADRDAVVFPFDDAMASDTAFLMPIVLKECGEVFRGLDSLVDVAGGLGGAAAAIAAALPELRCTVLDLPQVVAKAPSGTNVQYVAGDMFESIPQANAVLLKVN